MTRSLPLLVWLLAVWFALWEEVSVANALSGLAVAGAITYLHPLGGDRQGRLHPLAAARLLAYFAWKLLEATALVAWEVLTPRSHIRQGILAVPLRTTSPTITTLVANMITLTPGTVTIDIDEGGRVLYVHVLHLHDPEAVRRDLRHLEALTIAAFGSRSAIDAAGGSPPAGALDPSKATTALRHETKDDGWT